MQGRIASRDLLENGFSVAFADIEEEGSKKMLGRFSERTAFFKIDIRDLDAVADLIKKTNVRAVLNCAEGDWNLSVYRAALLSGVSVLDLGSDIPMTKDQIELDSQFKEKDLVAITGVGSTPGVNNIMLHFAIHKHFDSVHSIEAGFAWDSNVKKFVVPFSMQSIVEEFTEPASYIDEGSWLKIDPRESGVRMKFRDIDEQTFMIVRHPETYTFNLHYKNDGLKNLKYYAGFPDHSRVVIENLIDLGLGSKEKRVINGVEVRPVDLLTSVFRDLKFPEGYTEKENLWVKIHGEKSGEQKELLMECIVNTLPGWEDAGCNIDTGMPASIMTQMVLDGRIKERGSFEPGPVVPAEDFFAEIGKRSMVVYDNGEKVN